MCAVRTGIRNTGRNRVLSQIPRQYRSSYSLISSVSARSPYEPFEEIAAATDDHARSSEQLAGMVDEAVDELHDLERRLGKLTATAQDQYRQVEGVKQPIDRLDR